ncbi:MAG TPA: cyanophycinase [Pseudolysinimonas sp.]|nr:cyanophycinase [Pseudolysinimonas sp.]
MSEGTIIAIGGHEDRTGERLILRAIAAAMCSGPLLIVATASAEPDRYLDLYRPAFARIGCPDVRDLPVRQRSDARDTALLDAIGTAGGVFLTGGSQRRLVGALRDTPMHDALRALVRRGGVVAGTSAGASAFGETMLSGTKDLQLTTGLGMVPGVIIDQHFAQRNRVGRLTEGLAQAGVRTGIGIDEDTALVIRGGEASVIGSGAVWLLEGGASAVQRRAGARFALDDTIAA